MFDTIIIGGGASGLACAVMIKQINPSLKVLICEAQDRVGRKLSVTGNGRCNISNTTLDISRYHGDSEFAMKVISEFSFEKQRDFFNTIGAPFIIEQEGKAYPSSLQASSVVDVLRFEADELKVEMHLNEKVTDINKNDFDFEVKTNKSGYKCKTIVLATGGKAGIKSFDMTGYNILKKFGHKIEKLSPSIVQLKTENNIVKQIKGVKAVGRITISSENYVRSEIGEILFCDYGVSGPPVLQISRIAGYSASRVSIDFFPDIENKELTEILKKRISHQKNRQISELFTGLLNKRLGQTVLKLTGCNLNDYCHSISEQKIDSIVKTLKSFKLKVIGTTGFENAQVTAGGAQAKQFFDTLMSKKVKGLFAIGEILDVDGDCGGFNLAFAWASANMAAKNIVKYLNQD